MAKFPRLGFNDHDGSRKLVADCLQVTKPFSIQVSGCTFSEAEKFGVVRAPLHPQKQDNLDGEVAADSADWIGSSERSDHIMKFATTSKEADPFAGLSMDTSGAPITVDQDFLSGLETFIPNGTEDSRSIFEGLTVGGGSNDCQITTGLSG